MIFEMILRLVENNTFCFRLKLTEENGKGLKHEPSKDKYDPFANRDMTHATPWVPVQPVQVLASLVSVSICTRILKMPILNVLCIKTGYITFIIQKIRNEGNNKIKILTNNVNWTVFAFKLYE